MIIKKIIDNIYKRIKRNNIFLIIFTIVTIYSIFGYKQSLEHADMGIIIVQLLMFLLILIWTPIIFGILISSIYEALTN